MGKMETELFYKGGKWHWPAWLLLAVWLFHAPAEAFTVSVVDNQGNQIAGGFRWLLEEDNTNLTVPGAQVANSIGLDIHKSHAPLAAKGQAPGSSATVTPPDLNKRYFISVLPNSGYSLSGTSVAPGQNSVRVVVHKFPIPAAQISVYVFEDHNPINNAPDPAERGLAGWDIHVFDYAGPVSQDVFGMPLMVKTDTDGKALIRDLPPGKYGIRATPPGGETGQWVQTATIEGTPGIDAWVKANEPPLFVEGFGTGFAHAFIGFVRASALPWAVSPPAGTGSITGTNVFHHFPRPGAPLGFFSGPPVSECWVGLNDITSQTGLFAAPCDADSSFTIPNVPPGTYQLVTWDKPLDALFGFSTVTVPPAGGVVDLGEVRSFRWFGTLKGTVFYDADQNGFRDEMEMGISNQVINLRYRDGTIYQSTVTDTTGEYEFAEVFPFFKWLVTEVDFTRFKATGLTAVVDDGGPIQTHNGWTMPSFNILNPQPQTAASYPPNGINPNTTNNLSRTQNDGALTQAMQLYLNQANYIDWGKANYALGENGGISGIVYYAVTRAENDPALAAAEPWEPGIPRVQVNLYQDFNIDGVPDGPAVATAYTDSWDDNPPTDCIQPDLVIHGQPVSPCYDNYSTWNQVRPGVFDGGYAFGPDLPPGTYIVEVIPPPGYELVKEEDKNVDFGEEYQAVMTAALLAEGGPLGQGAPPASRVPPCVGPLHQVPAELTLFPGVAAPFAGELRPLCNRKQIAVGGDRNAALDFYLFTEVPKAARAVGFVNNDLSAEFNAFSPIFGEKAAPAWIPISFQDWAGNEVARVYADEFGAYNTLLPSTFTMNIPAPSGVSPNMINICLNHPLMTDPANPNNKIIDPFFDPNYSQSCWTFNYTPGTTTYTDTPIVPVGAFVGYPSPPLDTLPADRTPVISSVSGSQIGGPWVPGPGWTVTILSPGTVAVPNPDFPTVPGSAPTIQRDYGFGNVPGTVKVGGIPLTGVTWSNLKITGKVPSGMAGGQMMITRGDNQQVTEIGLTLHVGGRTPRVVNPGQSIQKVIDAATAGELIIVKPGTYLENVILYKPVRLQGAGAWSTLINATPFPVERLQAWHDKIVALLGTDPFLANEAPGIMVLGNVVGNPFPDPASTLPRIDGLTVTGSLAGGGIYVNSSASNLQVTNNRIYGNQGTYGGGITLGTPDTGLAANNNQVAIQYNYVTQNSGIMGGGGISIYSGCPGYAVRNNFISGNFSRQNGGGINHYGLSNNGVIANNKITFNEVFFGAAIGGDGGGIFVGGENPLVAAPPPITLVSEGAGNVTIQANLIQGNLAGSGSGGGIRAWSFNGMDLIDDAGALTDPATWYSLRIFNNLIVNNVAGYAAGGLALQDVARSEIVHNTVADNDSTATAANAFTPGLPDQSNPQGAGIVSNAHSPNLQNVAAGFSQTYADPTLVNNIIYHNRSYYWDVNAGTVVGQGGLVAAPQTFHDLAVTGTLNAADTLNPQYCLLTSDTYGGANNVTGDPAFVSANVNTPVSAMVIDEGGNSISVRFTPLRLSGNYHLAAATSPAVDQGTSTPLSPLPAELHFDFDGLARPAGAGWDMGALEYRGTQAAAGALQPALPPPVPGAAVSARGDEGTSASPRRIRHKNNLQGNTTLRNKVILKKGEVAR